MRDHDKRAKPITVYGVTYPSITQMCKAHNIVPTTFRQRVDVEGMSPEQAIETPPKRNPHSPAPRIEGVKFQSISEALAHYHIPMDLYRERRTKGWEILTAIVGAKSLGSDKANEPCYARDRFWNDEAEMCTAHHVSLDIYMMRVEKNNWPRSRACCLPEIITNARNPMMFPDELRRVINTYTCEAHKEGECTIWPGQLAKSGFIEVYAMRKRYSVPRLVYCMEHDVHPNDLSSRVSVSPACGNVRCIHPGHMLAVLNRRRNNWKGPRPDDQPEQDTPVPEITFLPVEVLEQAKQLRRTGWMDVGAIAAVLHVDVNQLKHELGI